MIEKWRISLDKGGYGGAILMDLSKAFDTLNHDLLIAKLHAYGFDKNALKLIKSYLSNRWQRTKVNHSFSSWSELLVGVPQGSVLGPLLFNLFINDLFYIIQDSDICNYADDNTLHASDLSLESLMARLESNVKRSIERFEYNGMKLNSKKCHLLICGHKYEIMIGNINNAKVIESTDVKLLGVLIDSKLTFNVHMGNICKKASNKLNALSRLCAILPFYRRIMLMNAFFRSQFCYCPLVWMFHNRSINRRIDNLHYRALRIVYADQTSSFQELLVKDGSITVHHQNLQYLAIEMFKVTKGIAPTFMNDIFGKIDFKSNRVPANTRSQSQFYNRGKTKTVNNGLETLRSLGPKLWDRIPEDMKQVETVSSFKIEIKKWTPVNCPCRLCRNYIPNLGYI